MAKQTILDEQQESQNSDDNLARNESPDVVNVNRSRNDSEDAVQQCGGVGGMCGVDGVLCSSGSVIESMFPYLSKKCNDDINTTSPRDVRSIIGCSSGAATLSPLTKPIRRGRFLVWPAIDDWGASLTACGPIAITSSASLSSE
jgi:hypothetical protein